MPITKRIQYRYDSVRNKIGMTDPDGGLHTYTYDVMRRLTGVINPLGERTTYTYDLNGRRTSVQLANGTRTSYVYDLGSRVQSVHTLKSDDSTVSKFEYEYDGNGRRTSVLEADGSRVTWTYDSISQVTSEWRTGTNPYRHTFTYDKCGNRTLKIEDGARTTLVYDAANQLVTSEDAGGTTTFTYDGNGNQTVVQKPSGDRTTQVWDYENRLIKTIQPSGGVTSMAYDADGLRLKLEEPTGTKLFVWDDQNYQAETDAAGATETAFTTEPSTYGSLISHRKSGASTTYHFDALGSTRALTDASEAVLERYNYTAFGTLLGSPTLLTPFLWGGMVGYYWDAALASQYIRARHYQPTIARWLSLDPIGFAGGDANLFRYVGNSPTSGATGMRVRLTASAYGRWQLSYRSGYNTYLGSFAVSFVDPSGLRIFGPPPKCEPGFSPDCPYTRVQCRGSDIPFPPPPPGYPQFSNQNYWGVSIQNFNDCLNAMDDAVRSSDFSDPPCVRDLEIFAHANYQGTNLGPEGQTRIDQDKCVEDHTWLGSRNVDEVASALRSQRMCCPCVIYLSGCNTGLLNGKGSVVPWPQRLANGTGCTVVGTKGYSRGTHLEGTQVVGPSVTYPPYPTAPGRDGTGTGSRSYSPQTPRTCDNPSDNLDGTDCRFRSPMKRVLPKWNPPVIRRPPGPVAPYIPSIE